MATEAQQRDDGFHKVKRISFLGSKRPIIMQNENGPCPLIGIGARGVFPFLPSPLKGGAPLCTVKARNADGERAVKWPFFPHGTPLFYFFLALRATAKPFIPAGMGGRFGGPGRHWRG